MIKIIERLLEVLLIFQPLIVAYLALLALRVNRKAQIHNESMTLIEIKREIRKLFLKTINLQEKKTNITAKTLEQCIELRDSLIEHLDDKNKFYLNGSIENLTKLNSKTNKILEDTTSGYKEYLSLEGELTIEKATELLFKVEAKAILNNGSSNSYIEESKNVLEKIKAVKTAANL